MLYSPSVITHLRPDQIFVFGSNLSGSHGGGAAWVAHKKFGARMGVGMGITGQCYAFPTLDKKMRPLTSDDLFYQFHKLFECAERNESYTFLVTKLGCGIAGYAPIEILSSAWKAMLLHDGCPANILWPEEWDRILFGEPVVVTPHLTQTKCPMTTIGSGI